jgi:hypothetical protein
LQQCQADCERRRGVGVQYGGVGQQEGAVTDDEKDEMPDELLDWPLIGVILFALVVGGGLLVLFDVVF